MPTFNTLYIAEKPSLAEGIALALADKNGLPKPRKGAHAWEVGNDRVTWLFGHMFEQVMPDRYDAKWKSWNLDLLPITVPHDGWKLEVVDDKKAHVSNVNSLIADARIVVNAGDAAREGQLLVDELLLAAGVNPFAGNVMRLWVSSVTRKDLLAALSSLKPNTEMKTLYNAAVCRQRSDWLFGMNLSRLYTKLAERGADRGGDRATVAVGRVKTPTLRLVVERDLERLAFRPVDHFTPVVTVKPGDFQATMVIPDSLDGLDSEGRLTDRTVADRIVKLVAGAQGKISDYKSEMKSKSAPLPYSLSALQAECSAKLGLSAKETLDIAQALYEQHKSTTYPRSDSRHLPLALHAESPGIVRGLSGVTEFREIASGADCALKSTAFDDSKVSDHHGIIPTSEFDSSKWAAMSDVERKVFAIIARAFVAQFYPAFRYRAATADVVVEDYLFRGTGRQIVDQGWRKVFGAESVSEDDDDDAASQMLPALTRGQDCMIADANAVAKRTKAPPAFTDGTLIGAMCNVHRFVTDPEAKKKLRETDGIGTEATRAATIEELLTGQYLTRGKSKNGLESTEFGRSVIAGLPRDISDAAVTAVWERKLADVQAGKTSVEAFLDAMSAEITQRIASSKNGSIIVKGAPARPGAPANGNNAFKLDGDGAACPKCGKGTMRTRTVTKDGPNKGKSFLSCSAYSSDGTGCSHTIWPGSAPGGGADKVDPLPGHGNACPKCGKGKLRTKSGVSKTTGKPYVMLGCDAYPGCNYSEFPKSERPAAKEVPPLPGHGKSCPKCGKGKLMTKEIRKKDGTTVVALSCDAYPGCQYTEWPALPKTATGGRR